MTIRIASGAIFVALAMAGPVAAADLPVKAPPVVLPAGTAFFELSGLGMNRSRPPSDPIFSERVAPGSGNIFNSGQFDPGWAAGVEGRAGFKYGVWGVEAAAFTMGEFRNTVPFPNATNIANGQIETNPAIGYGMAGARLDFKNESAIYGGEASGTWDPMRGVTLLAGARYIRLTDIFSIIGTSNFTNNVFEIDRWHVSNQLLGGQIGTRVDFLKAFGYAAGPWILEGNGRVGIYNNWIDSNFLLNGITRFTTSADHTSFSAQGGLSAGYWLNKNVALLVGYDALWINGVALSPNQVKVTPQFFNTTAPLGLATDSVLYQGVKVTLRVSN